MTAFHITPVDETSAPVLAALHAAAFQRLRETPWSAESFETLLSLPATFGFLAVGGETPAGFILCAAAGGDGEIYTLAVAPDHQRRGIARALLRRACKEALRRGADRMVLEVAGDNSPAIRLYRSQGFSCISTRADYYRRTDIRTGDPAVDARVMAMDLTCDLEGDVNGE